MPLDSTTTLVGSISTYMTQAVDCVLSQSKPFPRWVPPPKLVSGTFEKEAEQLYRQEMTKDKAKQDVEKMVNLGNEYYFSVIAKKAYIMLTRGRITSVAAAASVERGMAADNGFLKKKYIHAGDRANANDK